MEKNIALQISYDGTCFHGWQYQANAFSVQEAICNAWLDVAEEEINLIGSSRTDTGVHAVGIVANFITRSSIPVERIHLALNPLLPEGVSVMAAREVNREFNSRFDAIGKHYSYYYYLSSARPAILRNLSAHIFGEINISKMQAACPLFIGEKDFAALMDQGSQVTTTIREITHLQVRQISQEIIQMDVIGTGFLYHMIRILAGTLYYVGSGKIELSDLSDLIANKDRTMMGKTMPPQGLFLNKVYYEQELFGSDSLAEFNAWAN
ncbi:MAG: tRNA pseudouridine(38-40) synthase TruA [Saccharofermentanales bacterium]|jgi:tRNA pseudouridine38-40 synthase|nr:tRNA pseudouridine(38-40) synthase TruA [Bacillota bacterium]